VVGQIDLLGDGHAVLGDGGRAEAFLEDDVAALGAERYPDRAGQFADALAHGVAGFLVESDLLGRHSSSGSINGPTVAFRSVWIKGAFCHIILPPWQNGPVAQSQYFLGGYDGPRPFCHSATNLCP
jgi:hypothetical protein